MLKNKTYYANTTKCTVKVRLCELMNKQVPHLLQLLFPLRDTLFHVRVGLCVRKRRSLTGGGGE